MSSCHSFYEVLGVSQDASIDEVRKAYKRRVLETHPDKLRPNTPLAQKQESEAQFRQVYDAFTILSDPVKRQKYDTQVHNQQQHPSSQPESSHGPHPRSPSRRHRRKSEAERDRLQRQWGNYYHDFKENQRSSEQWHEQWKEWYAPWKDSRSQARAQHESWRKRSSKPHGSKGRERTSNDSEQTL